MKLVAMVLGMLTGMVLAGAVAQAAPPVSYSFTLDQAAPVPAGQEVSFTVTRSAPSGDVAWVKLNCDGGVGYLIGDPPVIVVVDMIDYPVIWGTGSSLIGHVAFQFVFGPSCTAIVTETPWRPHRSDPSLTFGVN